MAGLLANFRNTMIVSLLLAGVMIYCFGVGRFGDPIFWQALLRWVHVLAGVLWIGLLYYFNFVQIRRMPDIPAELKPAVSKYIAPEALFWFRWAALVTVLAGLVTAFLRGADYAHETLTLGLAGGFQAGDSGFTLMGVGMWLGIIMMLNVWGFIWPNQKIALGIKDGYDADAKAKAARTAMLFSRTNLLLSLPMLVSMTMYQTLVG
ncbi:MAG: hypothetical protein J0L52_08505 [Caulobacterales bacterium]|nr:hypothetical protein [Caulobacterales bacterium]